MQVQTRKLSINYNKFDKFLQLPQPGNENINNSEYKAQAEQHKAKRHASEDKGTTLLETLVFHGIFMNVINRLAHRSSPEFAYLSSKA